MLCPTWATWRAELRLADQLAAAEAATKEARANLQVAESQFDRQARETAEQATAQVQQVQKRLDLANANFKRVEAMIKTSAASQQDYDNALTRMLGLEEEQKQAAAGQKIGVMAW